MTPTVFRYNTGTFTERNRRNAGRVRKNRIGLGAGGRRELRKARQSAVSTANSNLKCIISLLSEQRLAVEQEIHEAQHAGDKDKELELRKKANSITDDLSKLNKALKDNDKSNGITLGLYIDVMDDVFNNMRTYSPELYESTLEFQSMLIQKKTIELG